MKVYFFKNWSLLLVMACLFLLAINFNGKVNAAGVENKISDSTITLKIKAKYFNNPLLNPLDIKVTTIHGFVHLSGIVDTSMQYETAVILAEDTDGIRDVNSSDLIVKSSPTPTNDTIITAKIKGIFLKNNIFKNDTMPESWTIHVETANGIVYLSGSVKDSAERDKAIHLVKSVKGVKGIKADLKYTQQ